MTHYTGQLYIFQPCVCWISTEHLTDYRRRFIFSNEDRGAVYAQNSEGQKYLTCENKVLDTTLLIGKIYLILK